MTGPARDTLEYVETLERRIAEQRKHIESLKALRDQGGNRADRKRIAHLERALGSMTLRWHRATENFAAYRRLYELAPGFGATSTESEAHPEGNDGSAGVTSSLGNA